MDANTMQAATLVQTARYEALHGSAIGCAGLVKNLADTVAALTAENEVLRRALIAHRTDLHNGSSRPCSTCYQSAHALGIADRVPDCCALADADAAALPSSRETTDGGTDPS